MQEENKMGTLPVRKLLISMSWPIMLSMFIQALYNMVDSMFVARISEDALLALSLAFPIQSFMIALAVGTGAGVNAMLARRLGERRSEDANATAEHGYFVYFLYWIAFVVFGLTLARPFMGFFTDDPVVAAYGVQYLSIVTCGSLGMFMQFAAERVLQATGHPMGNMLVQGVGAVINIILDPILIFVFHMDVIGAAVATIFGQLVGMCVGFYLVSRVKEVRVNLRHFRPRRAILADIYRIGFPAIVTQSIITVMTFGMNKILSLFSATYVLVFGLYFKLQNFIFMPIFGLNSGMVPILSFNFGARHKRRITATIRFAMVIAVCIMALGTLLMQLFPAAFLSLFNPTAATLAAGVPAIRTISLSFLFAGVSIILSSAFQALGAPSRSLLIALLRQLILVLPLSYLMGAISPNLVWWAFPIADIFGAALAVFFFWRLHRHQLLPMQEQYG